MIPESAIIQWRNVVPWSIFNQWFSGKCDILTYQLSELIATKLKALYERRKGRDLYDLFRSLQDERLNSDHVMTSFLKFMENEGKKPTYSLFTTNVEEKLKNKEFLGDTKDLLRPGTVYDPIEAYLSVKKELIDKLL